MNESEHLGRNDHLSAYVENQRIVMNNLCILQVVSMHSLKKLKGVIFSLCNNQFDNIRNEFFRIVELF